MVDRSAFEYPVYEGWSRSTIHDGRGRNGEGEGLPFTLQIETRDIVEVRQWKRTVDAIPSFTTQVRVRWDLDKAAYTEAVEREQLEELRRKYPAAT